MRPFAHNTEFLDPGPLEDEELRLVLTDVQPAAPARGRSAAYLFAMQHVRGGDMGRISLRVANTPEIQLYVGHVGYGVKSRFRGRHYAARSCRLLFPLARAHGLNPLWITCNPDNTASRRTCEELGGECVEVVPVPKDHELYQRGDHFKCRYRIEL